MTTFPPTIIFLSDSNEAKFQGLVPEKKKEGKQGEYIYTKSKTKKGMTITVSLDYLNKLVDDGLLKVREK